MSVYKASRNIPANHFLLWMGGVGEVQLRLRAGEGGHHPVFFFEGGGGKVRLRVRWSLRAMCAQSPAHHPSTPFFVCGGGGLGRFDFGFGVGFGGHGEQCLYKASCIIPANRFLFVDWGGWGGSTSGSASGSLGIARNFRTKPGASSQQPFFLSRGGWGGSTSGSASGSMVISSNVCTKPGASCQQTFGAWGGSTSGSALGTRLLSNRNIISSAFGTQSSVRQ